MRGLRRWAASRSEIPFGIFGGPSPLARLSVGEKAFPRSPMADRPGGTAHSVVAVSIFLVANPNRFHTLQFLPGTPGRTPFFSLPAVSCATLGENEGFSPLPSLIIMHGRILMASSPRGADCMQSIWNYLRTRTRDSMLAGMKDALDQAEQGENIQDTQETAARLVDQPTGELPSPLLPSPLKRPPRRRNYPRAMISLPPTRSRNHRPQPTGSARSCETRPSPSTRSRNGSCRPTRSSGSPTKARRLASEVGRGRIPKNDCHRT